MRLHYFQETDGRYTALKPGPGAEVPEVAPGRNVDLDAADEVVGFDIDHASRKLDLTSIETAAWPIHTARCLKGDLSAQPTGENAAYRVRRASAA